MTVRSRRIVLTVVISEEKWNRVFAVRKAKCRKDIFRQRPDRWRELRILTHAKQISAATSTSTAVSDSHALLTRMPRTETPAPRTGHDGFISERISASLGGPCRRMGHCGATQQADLRSDPLAQHWPQAEMCHVGRGGIAARSEGPRRPSPRAFSQMPVSGRRGLDIQAPVPSSHSRNTDRGTGGSADRRSPRPVDATLSS